MTDFFTALGLDPEKPAEIYAIDEDLSPGSWLYGGWRRIHTNMTVKEISLTGGRTYE